MSETRLATYRPSDREGFASLVNDVHAEFGFAFDAVLDVDLADPEAHYGHILLVRSGGAVVGSAALTMPRDGVVTLKRLYLRPSFRHQGWGRRLLEEVTVRAALDGCTRIDLDTSTGQHDARRLYEQAGFHLDRSDGDSLWFSRDLTGSGEIVE